MRTDSQVFLRYISLIIQGLLIAGIGGSLTYALLIDGKSAIVIGMLFLLGIGCWQMLDALIGALGGNKWRRYYFAAAIIYLFLIGQGAGFIPPFLAGSWVPRALWVIFYGVLPFMMAVSFWYLSREEVNGKTIIA